MFFPDDFYCNERTEENSEQSQQGDGEFDNQSNGNGRVVLRLHCVGVNFFRIAVGAGDFDFSVLRQGEGFGWQGVDEFDVFQRKTFNGDFITFGIEVFNGIDERDFASDDVDDFFRIVVRVVADHLLGNTMPHGGGHISGGAGDG